MKFLHLSDLHFSYLPKKNKPIQKALDFIKKEYPKHRIIITGDVVDDGIENQYEQAVKALKPFLGRLFICPGNHDFGLLGNIYNWTSAKLFDEYIGVGLSQSSTYAGANLPVVSWVKEDGEDPVMLIGLDTNLETVNPFDFACGEVGEKQLAVLEAMLNDNIDPRVKKILYFHHHPYIRNDPFMELVDARQLMRMIFKRVDVVCFGHRHVSEKKENANSIPFILAADNMPGKDFAREISFDNGGITVSDVPILPGVVAKP